MSRKLYIMRGLSGSGKSTLAKKIVGEGLIFSTDDLFIEKGEYKFNPGKLGVNHKQNQTNAIEAMKDGVSPIVIDNTHTQSWEAKPYVKAGLNYDYEVTFLVPETDWAFDAGQLASRNTHGVPKAAIERMLSRWEEEMTVESCLNAKPPKR
jgi:predicted kinase